MMDCRSTLSWIFGLLLVVAVSAQEPVHTQVFTLLIDNASPYELVAPEHLPPPRPQLTWSISPERALPSQSMVVTAVLNRTGDQPGVGLDHTLPFRTVVNGEEVLAPLYIRDRLLMHAGNPAFVLANHKVNSLVEFKVFNSNGHPKDLSYLKAGIQVFPID